MQRVRPTLEFCQSCPAARKLLAGISLFSVCSVFHLIVVLCLLAIWPIISSSAPSFTAYVGPLLLILCIAPGGAWPAVNRCFELWFDHLEISANTPNVQPGGKYLFVLAPHGVFPFWSWPYSSYLARVLKQDKAVGGGALAYSRLLIIRLTFVSGVASVLLRLPILRTLCLWTGCVPATREALALALQSNSQQLVVVCSTFMCVTES